MSRVILHSDMNCFYASVEMMLDPKLRNRPLAVGGSRSDRHGIILAKSEEAKRMGVTTGMTLSDAQRCCPELVIVPPQFDQYVKYSKLAHEIYSRYTDLIEPFGLDECWLDVTASTGIFGSGEVIAETIRRTIREELGLTVSIGVSFNKVFAKLGSDMKKPDAVTVISKENFRDKIWQLPASELLFAGRSTVRKLAGMGIYTIGQIAQCEPAVLQKKLGKNGVILHSYASGHESSPVMQDGCHALIQSVGHGVTCTEDLADSREVGSVMLALSVDISRKLLRHGLYAEGVQIAVRDTALKTKQWQTSFSRRTRDERDIAFAAAKLFDSSYVWTKKVRSVTVRAINLVSEDMPVQCDLFEDTAAFEKRERLDEAVEALRCRYGSRSIVYGAAVNCRKLPRVKPVSTLPQATP